MNLKAYYIILVILFICCSIGFLFFRERTLFFLYGYEQNLIKADTPESFAAFKRIALGKKIFLMLSILLSFGCAAASYYVRKNRLDINYYFVSIVLYVSLICLIIFLIGFVLSFFIPTRIV